MNKKKPKPITLVCVFCGKEFSAIARNKLYCSNHCKAKASLERQKAAYKAPVKRVRRRPAQTIAQVMRELDEYNKTHKKEPYIRAVCGDGGGEVDVKRKFSRRSHRRTKML